MKTTFTALTLLALAAASGSVQAASITLSSAQALKPKLQVVSDAKMISATEKSDVTGMCGCGETPPPPAPTPEPSKAKPGYGFGAKVEHYGPPGQGFTPDNTWRDARAAGQGTPKGGALPPRAFK